MVDNRLNRLERIVPYATVKNGEFSLRELINVLKTYDFEVDFADLVRSLDRLKVSYILDVANKRTYLRR